MTSIPKGKNIMWTAEMDSVLIRVLYDEAVSGNRRADNGWKPASLQHVVAQVSAVSGSAPQAKHVRSRLKTMKKEYSCAKVCLDLSGFTFNPETKLIEGDDIAWADYLGAYPKSCFLRTKMLPCYDEMVMIFGKDMANGSGHVEAHDETETEGELLPRDLLDDIDDTEIEIEEDPLLAPRNDGIGGTDDEGFLSDLGVAAGSGGISRRRRGPGSSVQMKRSRSRFSNGEDPEIKKSFEALAEAAKDIAHSFKSPDYAKIGDILSQMENLTG